MKLAFVTTWGQHCGISTYSEELIECLREEQDLQIFVAAPGEMGVGIRDENRLAPWRSVWQRREVHFEQLVTVLKDFDVVHFQHEYGLFQINQAFLAVCRDLQEAGVRVVVTLHTVYPFGGFTAGGFHAMLAACVDAIIVHTIEAAATLHLDARGTGVRIYTVPHGARVADKGNGDLERGVRLLGLPKALHAPIMTGSVPVCLIYGFQGPNTNTFCTLRGFAQACSLRLAGSAILVVCGEAADDRFTLGLGNAIDEAGYLTRMFLQPTFTPAQDVPHLLSVASFSVLTTNSRIFSSSGAAHALAAHGVPVAVAERPIYRETIGGGARSFALDDEYLDRPTPSLLAAIGALAVSGALRAEVGGALSRWAEQVSWPVVAKRHMEIYKGVLG